MQGVPFMESLTENRALFYSLVASFGLVVGLTCGVIPPIAEMLKIVDFPGEFRTTLIIVLIGNLIATFTVDRICRWLFGEGKLKKL